MNNEKQQGRAGVGICVITRGTVSVKWMQHMNKLASFHPIGMFWKYIFVEGEDGWAKNRIEAVKKVRKENFEWVLFIDDDVFVPKDVMRIMLSKKKDILTGIYWTKSEPSAPVIFEKEGGGPMYDFPLDKVFEISGSGLGCCLINMSVFDKFDKANIPYFKENWTMELDDGRKIKCPIGEDHYFFYHAKKLGFKVWADSGILCDHYDVKNKIFFPSEEAVRELCRKKLQEDGREDVIEEYDKALGRDPNKKTITFVNHTYNAFSGDELERRGCGGSEGDIINLAKVFANEHEFNVHVFCTCPRPGVYDNVIYHDLITSGETLKSLNSDLLILSRNTDILTMVDFKKEFNAKTVCLWTHDMPGDPVYNKIEEAYKNVDKIFALTEFHKDELLKFYPFMKNDKIFIARNGINKKRFKNRDKIEKIPGRLIYSSTPFRGLEILADVFPEIRKRVPHAHLRVFSSMKVYGEKYDDDQFEPLYNRLKNMEGVEYFGTIKQDRLAQEHMKAQILAYPNTFPETCCITAFEAQSAGTPIVISNLGALKETAPDDVAIRIDGNPHSKEYKEKFIDSIVELLTNKEKWEKMHKACLGKDYSWSSIAKEWITEFFPNRKIECSDSMIITPKNINTPEYWDVIYENEIESGIDRNDSKEIDLVTKSFNGGAFLDVGCGTGSDTRYIKDNFPNADVFGCDFSQTAIDYCKQKNDNISYYQHAELDKLYQKNYFDMILMSHLIEHINNPTELIKKSQGILKEDGTLVLVIPINDDPWKEHLKIWHLNDIEVLLREFDCDYTIRQIKTNRIYRKDGRRFEEAIVTIQFKNN